MATLRIISLSLFVVFYAAAGIMHFLNPGLYLRIMPSWLPFPETLVYLSGIVEIGVAVLMIFPGTRRLSSWITILMLLSFFMVHIDMLVHADEYAEIASEMALWLRLPVQLLLIWWAWNLGRTGSHRT